MDANLESIGARCHFCQRQDFLPFTCHHCSQNFCLSHSSQLTHACPIFLSSTLSAPSIPVSGGDRKAVGLKELQAQHVARQYDRHNKSTTTKGGKQQISESMQDRLMSLKSLMPSKFTLRGASSTAPSLLLRSTTAPSVSRVSNLALLKRKNAARGDLSVATIQSKYCIEIGLGEKRQDWNVHRDWTVGRCLDSIALAWHLLNENNRTLDDAKKLHLWSGGLVLAPAQKLSMLVKEGDLVILYRGIERPA